MITYVPTSLESMIAIERRSVMNRDGEVYCVECQGGLGDLTHVYGALILQGTIREINLQLADHDSSHNVTLVDRDNCQMGM